jgi:hypothetical protein
VLHEGGHRPRASAMVGFRYLNIDLEKDYRVGTFDADIEIYGPFLGVDFQFDRHVPRSI